MHLDRDSIAYLNFHLPRQYPELFETLRRAVQAHLDGLKAAGTLPEDIDLYRLVLDFDVRPREEIAERQRYAAAFRRRLEQELETASAEKSIEF